jgi:hypothetical protein
MGVREKVISSEVGFGICHVVVFVFDQCSDRHVFLLLPLQQPAFDSSAGVPRLVVVCVHGAGPGQGPVVVGALEFWDVDQGQGFAYLRQLTYSLVLFVSLLTMY